MHNQLKRSIKRPVSPVTLWADKMKHNIIKSIQEILLYAIWFPTLIFLSHVIVWFMKVYEVWPPIDIPMHFLGGVSITYFFWKSISICGSNSLSLQLQTRVKVVLALSLTGSTTVLWEFAEYIADHTMCSGIQLGLEDTLLDMLLGILGAIFYIGIVVWKRLQYGHRCKCS